MAARRPLRSWVDVVTDAVDRLPGPPWAAYAILVALSVAIPTLIRWSDGATVDALAILFAGLTFTPFALLHYTNRAARRALEDFRPALGAIEPEYERFERQLTTTSFATGIVGAVIGIGLVLAGVLTVGGGGWGVSAENSLATNIVTGGLLVIFNASLATFVLHELGHLRTIARIHRDATNLQLWNVPPQNAFARVTGLAAVALTVPYVGAALFSAVSTSNSVVAVSIVVVVLGFAGVLFVGPLLGMRRRLVREKERQLGETDRAFEVAAARLRDAVDAGELGGAGDLQNALSALTLERERLRKVSTWPWTADTLRAVLTSLGLPVLLWLVTTLLGRVLFG